LKNYGLLITDYDTPDRLIDDQAQYDWAEYETKISRGGYRMDDLVQFLYASPETFVEIVNINVEITGDLFSGLASVLLSKGVDQGGLILKYNLISNISDISIDDLVKSLQHEEQDEDGNQKIINIVEELNIKQKEDEIYILRLVWKR